MPIDLRILYSFTENQHKRGARYEYEPAQYDSAILKWRIRTNFVAKSGLLSFSIERISSKGKKGTTVSMVG